VSQAGAQCTRALRYGAPESSVMVRVGGFRFAAVSAGIKKDSKPDLGLVVADGGAVAAGVFTRNLVRAAPVDVAAERLRVARSVHAILVNSGCANACTGRAGLDATLLSTRAIAEALVLDESSVLPASTGVIGVTLPHERVIASADDLVAGLGDDQAQSFAEAICTTDRWPKLADESLGDGRARLLGIAKGAGMIHPDMGLVGSPHQATLLAFLFTDALVRREVLEYALVAAVDKTFNACSVDGDTSTNDTVIALASGASGYEADAGELGHAMFAVCDKLARSIVADGEGADHVAEIHVRGLSTTEDARIVARTVATSLLVKTALHGKDANWGRLLAAAGRAGVRFDPSRARIAIGGVDIVRDGVTLGGAAEKAVAAVLAQSSYVIELDLGGGPGEFVYLTSDLGHGYVDVNASYRS
jgi:glutamate N-acetyltransferase / amino-acid N-acetyltransferase